MGGDGETQTHLHAARVELHLAVDGVGHLGEFDDGVETGVDVAPGESEHAAEHVDVLPAAQQRVDAAADLEQRTDAPVGVAPAGRLEHGPADAFEQGRFPRAVDADQAHRPARLDLQVDVFQHPAPRAFLAAQDTREFGQLVAQVGFGLVGPEALPGVLDDDRAVS